MEGWGMDSFGRRGEFCYIVAESVRQLQPIVLAQITQLVFPAASDFRTLTQG